MKLSKGTARPRKSRGWHGKWRQLDELSYISSMYGGPFTGTHPIIVRLMNVFAHNCQSIPVSIAFAAPLTSLPKNHSAAAGMLKR